MIHRHSSQKNKIQIISTLKTENCGPNNYNNEDDFFFFFFFFKFYINSAEKRGNRLVDRIFTTCKQKTPSVLNQGEEK